MKNDTKTHGVKLEYFFYVSNNKINPLEHSNKEFIHYDIPSFDKYKGPKIEIGQDIKSIKNIVYPNSILVSKINPKFLRILTVKQCKDNCISSTEFLVLRFKKKENEELIDFFNALLNSSKFNNYLIMYANGTSCSHQRVKSKDILNYSFSSFSKTQMLFIGKMYCLIETKISILKMINSIL